MNQYPINELLTPFFSLFRADCLGAAKAELLVSSQSDGLFHVRLCYDLTGTVQQDDCRAVLGLAFMPDFFWTPHLTPTDEHIAAEHIFRTPALIARGSGKTAILIPDVESPTPVPRYLDLDAPRGQFTIGLSNYTVDGHVLYRRASGAFYPPAHVELSFYLMVFDCELENPFRPVLGFFWEKYGVRDTGRLPAMDSLENYCGHTYDWAFRRWKSVVWQEFELNGKMVGAPVFIVTVNQRPTAEQVCSERETRSIWNQAWFSSLRSASGLFRYAKRQGRTELMEYARQTKELALAFPQDDGLFCGIIATQMQQISEHGCNIWVSGGWDCRYWGNSDRNPFVRDIRKAPRHILDMSFTAYYMLAWFEELENDERLLRYAVRYADRLLRLQLGSGYYPAWVDECGNPMGVLDDSPESAMSTAFLLRLYRLTGNEAYKLSAERALEIVCRKVIPSGRWEDFETYWSCCTYWNDHVGEQIPRNGIYKQCNFSMYFTALALLERWQTDGDKQSLILGWRVLDELLMTQSSYQPHVVPIPVCGGFGVMNADAELNDARQSLFCELILQYGKLLGNAELVERGMAALRVSFSMMYCPENPDTKKQWELAWPFLGPNDYGFNMENYGHGGMVDPNGIGIGEFTIYDWGNGAAAENYQRLLDHGMLS